MSGVDVVKASENGLIFEGGLNKLDVRISSFLLPSCVSVTFYRKELSWFLYQTFPTFTELLKPLWSENHETSRQKYCKMATLGLLHGEVKMETFPAWLFRGGSPLDPRFPAFLKRRQDERRVDFTNSVKAAIAVDLFVTFSGVKT